MRFLWFGILCVIGASPAVFCEEAVFDAAEPESGQVRLLEWPDAVVTGENAQGAAIVSPNPNTRDYFSRAGLTFIVPASFAAGAGQIHVIIEHMDTAMGLIQVSCEGAVVEGLAAYTCLGTNTARRAIFQVTWPAAAASGREIRIAGVASVRRVIFTTELAQEEIASVKEAIPKDLPQLLRLEKPMQLVMTVGADSRQREGLPEVIDSMREFCPLAARLGFSGVESYVKWNFVEQKQGEFDWSYYDAIVAEAQEHGLKWFPLLVVGSAYTLPEWYYESPLNEGFVCLEHGKDNNIQTIFCENQTPYVKTFLQEFGKHYSPTGDLLGVRLGPSGNFGESQYPAGGNWGYKWQEEHIHIGWWAGDHYAAPHFVEWLKERYATIESLNAAWQTTYSDWDAVKCFVPQFAETNRQRKDIVDWYMEAMTDWCNRWAVWAREAMPDDVIYQSAGGWGFVESGTDFTDQTKGIAAVKGGIRATNETDSYAQNFQVTRMMSSAARFYKVPFGSEPAGFNSAKGVASRIYNILVNNGQHLFFYYPNLTTNDQAIDTWLELAPMLDQRAEPVIDVAVLYPDTLSKLDDGVFRNLYASSFYQRIAGLRPHLDFDYCGEQMVRDGALSRYKVLVLAWSNIIEAGVLNAIDAWVRDGGTVMALEWGRMPIETVEGDRTVFNTWVNGDTGAGRVDMITEDREPPHRFADRVMERLLEMKDLHPMTQAMLRTDKPDEVYVSALETGRFAVLNYNDYAVNVTIPGYDALELAPYRIALAP